jgi:lysine/ornithine N-monooxygenase
MRRSICRGATEHAFGLASSLLSTVAVRAGQIVEAIQVRRCAATPAPVAG